MGIYALKDYFTNELTEVDRILRQQIADKLPLIGKVTEHLINAGGKKLRPSLTLASCSIFGALEQPVYALAAAIELIHSATLLHDDVIDQSNDRRQKPTAHLLWGGKTSILVGDFLFASAFQLMVQGNNLQIMGNLANASAHIAEGEVLQLSLQHNLQQTMDECLKIISTKTAVLFAVACQTGALMGGADSTDAQNFYDFGFYFGLSYQIIDDLLDYGFSVDDRITLPSGNDFAEGKITLPVLLAMAKTPKEDIWQRCFVNLCPVENDLQKVQELINTSLAIKDALALAKSFTEKAVNILNKYQHPNIKLLKTLLYQCLQRKD